MQEALDVARLFAAQGPCSTSDAPGPLLDDEQATALSCAVWTATVAAIGAYDPLGSDAWYPSASIDADDEALDELDEELATDEELAS